MSQRVAADVRNFIEGVSSPVRRRDARAMVDLMARASGEPAAMWGASIVGFGTYHYRYASGREGDAPAASFSPRKAATTIYLPDGVDAYAEPLSRLGEHTTGVGCVYVKDLDRVDISVLERIVSESYAAVTSGTFGNQAAESSDG